MRRRRRPPLRKWGSLTSEDIEIIEHLIGLVEMQHAPFPEVVLGLGLDVGLEMVHEEHLQATAGASSQCLGHRFSQRGIG